MFTGIIEDLGKVKSIVKTQRGATFEIEALFADQLKIGDSVAVNGACSTVISKNSKSFSVEYSLHTLSLTTLSFLNNNERVNLERAMNFSDRINGHLVSGHIDGVTKLISINDEGFAKKISFILPEEYKNQIVKKGSIAIDGISLTISDVDDRQFSVTIIPHTLNNTTLCSKNVGNLINFETDLISKYIEKVMLAKNINTRNSNIDEQFLAEKGFL